MATIHCLVDNSAMRGSALWGEHGVSFLIETPDGRVLFDVGQSGEVLAHNVKQMNIELKDVNALVLSHAHNDHTGGLERFFTLTDRKLPLYANPDLFRERYSIKDDRRRFIGLRLSPDQLARHVNLQLHAEPMQILPCVWTSGEILERAEFEGSSPNLYIQGEKGFSPDPYRDDLSLVIEVDAGLVLVCGCCHAGLLNTLAHVRRVFARDILAVIGGTHLVSARDDLLAHAIDVLGEYCGGNTPLLYPNHCSGERAFIALRQAYGDKVQPCPAGTVLSF